MIGKFEYRQGFEIFLFTTPSRPALRLIQSPIQGVPGALSLVVKRAGRETDHSPPSSAEVKEFTSTPSLTGTDREHDENLSHYIRQPGRDLNPSSLSYSRLVTQPFNRSGYTMTSALDGSEWSDSRPGRFTIAVSNPSTQWI
jgi:hypothetical protein